MASQTKTDKTINTDAHASDVEIENNSDNEVENHSDNEIENNSDNEIENNSSPIKKKKEKKDKKAKKKEKKAKKEKSEEKSKKEPKEKSKKEPKEKSKKAKKPVETEPENDEEDNASDDETSGGSDKKANSTSSKLNKKDILDIIKDVPEDDQTPAMKHYILLNQADIAHNEQGKRIKNAKHLAEKRAIDDYRQGEKIKDRGPINRKQTGFSQPYDVPDNLKEILDSDEFESYVIDATPKKGINAYDKEAENPQITPSQLVDACRNYFTALDEDSKGTVSLEDDTTPVYQIFSEYLENLEGGKLDKNYKPSQGTQDAERSSLSRIQMISFACKYLKWTNNL